MVAQLLLDDFYMGQRGIRLLPLLGKHRGGFFYPFDKVTALIYR